MPGFILIALALVACGSDGVTTSTSATTGPTNTTVQAGPATTAVTTTTLPLTDDGRVRHPDGASFVLPAEWEVVGAAIATEFTDGAQCVSGRIIDEPLVEGAPGPSLYQAVFQVCARRGDGDGLEEFMDRTYGENRTGFKEVVVANRDAYRSDQAPATIIFLANDSAIFQILTSVDTDPEVEELRRQQISEVLSSLTIE